MPSIRLLTGEVMTADTFEELYEQYSSSFMNATSTDEQFRETIEKRAMLWSGAEIDTTGSAQDFFHELERAGLILVASPQTITVDAKRPLSVSLPRLVYLRELSDKAQRATEEKEEYVAYH